MKATEALKHEHEAVKPDANYGSHLARIRSGIKVQRQDLDNMTDFLRSSPINVTPKKKRFSSVLEEPRYPKRWAYRSYACRTRTGKGIHA